MGGGGLNSFMGNGSSSMGGNSLSSSGLRSSNIGSSNYDQPRLGGSSLGSHDLGSRLSSSGGGYQSSYSSLPPSSSYGSPSFSRSNDTSRGYSGGTSESGRTV